MPDDGPPRHISLAAVANAHAGRRPRILAFNVGVAVQRLFAVGAGEDHERVRRAELTRTALGSEGHRGRQHDREVFARIGLRGESDTRLEVVPD